MVVSIVGAEMNLVFGRIIYRPYVTQQYSVSGHRAHPPRLVNGRKPGQRRALSIVFILERADLR